MSTSAKASAWPICGRTEATASKRFRRRMSKILKVADNGAVSGAVGLFAVLAIHEKALTGADDPAHQF